MSTRVDRWKATIWHLWKAVLSLQRKGSMNLDVTKNCYQRQMRIVQEQHSSAANVPLNTTNEVFISQHMGLTMIRDGEADIAMTINTPQWLWQRQTYV